ncbi:MAG: hypothetical protein RTV31_04700 [Candidatus Thorarchaeota archaeon]
MNRLRLTFGILLISLFLLIGTVSAQAVLVPNETRTNEYKGIGTKSYTADLDAGHWTVVLSSDFPVDLDFTITVYSDSIGLNEIANSGNETGRSIRADFTLDTNTTVYIRIRDVQEYGFSTGYFNIGVYDDAHVPGFWASLHILDLIIFFFVVFVLLFVGCIVFSVRRARRAARAIRESVAVQAPMHVIPDKYQGSVQRHGSQMTTVRLPPKCPSCGAEVSFEGIDWVGPLEAKCGYCGGTMRATFERI